MTQTDKCISLGHPLGPTLPRLTPSALLLFSSNAAVAPAPWYLIAVPYWFSFVHIWQNHVDHPQEWPLNMGRYQHQPEMIPEWREATYKHSTKKQSHTIVYSATWTWQGCYHITYRFSSKNVQIHDWPQGDYASTFGFVWCKSSSLIISCHVLSYHVMLREYCVLLSLCHLSAFLWYMLSIHPTTCWRCDVRASWCYGCCGCCGCCGCYGGCVRGGWCGISVKSAYYSSSTSMG